MALCEGTLWVMPRKGSRREPSALVHELEVADRPWSRLAGLQLRPALPASRGLLLLPCRSIHTHWMRFPIDALFLDESGVVVDVHAGVKPWRFVVPSEKPHAVLEVAGGSFRGKRGDRLYWDTRVPARPSVTFLQQSPAGLAPAGGGTKFHV